MPWAAPKPCAHTGCTVLVNRADRFCPAHQRHTWKQQARTRREDPTRRALDAQYRTQAWRRYSKQYLAEHPLCVACEQRGLICSAVVTDHIRPTASGGDFWSPSNHQALCNPCHRVKSAREVFGSAAGNAPASHGEPIAAGHARGVR